MNIKNINLILVLFIVLLTACNDNRQNRFAQKLIENKVIIDTIVGSKTITDELAGSAFRKRAIGYFVIIDRDTSDYSCIFTEAKDGGNVEINLNASYLKPAISYKKRLAELRIILPNAAKDFNFDLLTGISFGRLISSGDLAINVTKQYHQKFGASDKLKSYTAVAQFLKESKLGTDLNNVLKPYSISVDKVSIEKLFFTSPRGLYWASKIETDSLNVPDKILDCIIGVHLRKK
ncbi:hypothetical protein ABIB40_003988 [Pedobacter sp. UYP30]|uniref:hypothetical protein n=1 Tax=Pedobacter sp. UYP30 TaxID=1756400 RepID=UPI003398F493